MRSKQPNDSEYLDMGDYFSGEKAILTRLRSWVRVPHLLPLKTDQQFTSFAQGARIGGLIPSPAAIYRGLVK